MHVVARCWPAVRSTLAPGCELVLRIRANGGGRGARARGVALVLAGQLHRAGTGRA